MPVPSPCRATSFSHLRICRLMWHCARSRHRRCPPCERNPCLVFILLHRLAARCYQRLGAFVSPSTLEVRAWTYAHRRRPPVGWIIVTIIGFLTAVVAFLIVRSEQWLFDIKYEYCVDGRWKVCRFCCPIASEARTFALGALHEQCKAWVTWGEAFTDARRSRISHPG